MIDELVKTVRLHLSERLTSPLLGGFLVSWCAWNYRAFLVIFSDEKVLEKLRILERVLYPYDSWMSWGHGLVFPVLTTCAYIFLYPRPARFVYEHTRKKQRELLDIRRAIEDETPLTEEDSRRIRGELARAEHGYYTQLSTKDSEIEKLKGQVAALNEALSTHAQAIRDAESARDVAVENLTKLQRADSRTPANQLDDLEVKLLDAAIRNNDRIYDDQLRASSPESRLEIQVALHNLTRRGLIYRDGPEYHITDEGRVALLAHRRAVQDK